MSEHFIREIEIKNFKCFKDFRAEGFGRVNLIGGKNNIGKTAFMEACSILSYRIRGHEGVSILGHIIYLEKLRDKDLELTDTVLDFVRIFEKYDNLLIKSNGEEVTLKIEKDKLDKKFLFNNEDIGIDNKTINVPIKGIGVKEFNFIPSQLIENELIIRLFDGIKGQRKRERLNQFLNGFDKNIEEFDTIENRPKVFLENQEKSQDVSELGHGLKRYIAIISSILINKNEFLFLDEIENGIHYTQLDRLWEIILTLSKEQNVQVFATTHSKECIESYARVAKKLDDKDITFVEMCKRENEIKAFIYPFDWFIDEIEQEHEVRGCL
jgi:AAA15 family ATPase/GTPase